jgi:hypothetical protein
MLQYSTSIQHSLQPQGKKKHTAMKEIFIEKVQI